MGIKVHNDLDGVDRKLSPEAFNKARFIMASQMGADMNKLVPKGPPHAGALRESQAISRDGSDISWNTPYARRMFYGSSGWHYTTPGTGPHWDKKATAMYASKWTNAFKKGLRL